VRKSLRKSALTVAKPRALPTGAHASRSYQNHRDAEGGGLVFGFDQWKVREIVVGLLQLKARFSSTPAKPGCDKILAKKCSRPRFADVASYQNHRDAEGGGLVFVLVQEKVGEIVVRFGKLSCDKILAKKCFETSTSESKNDDPGFAGALASRAIVFELDQWKVGEIVVRFGKLSCDKILAKKCFETSSSQQYSSNLGRKDEAKSSKPVNHP